MENKEVKRDLSEASQQEMLLKERKANSAWRKLRRNKSAMFGLIAVILSPDFFVMSFEVSS